MITIRSVKAHFQPFTGARGGDDQSVLTGSQMASCNLSSHPARCPTETNNSCHLDRHTFDAVYSTDSTFSCLFWCHPTCDPPLSVSAVVCIRFYLDKPWLIHQQLTKLPTFTTVSQCCFPISYWLMTRLVFSSATD